MNTFLLCAMVAVAATEEAASQSVAVIPIQAKEGVTRDLSDLLTSSLADGLRRSGRFSRVVGASELESLIGFEKQRQLVDCSSESCMAEISGALGVDAIVTGSLGRVGQSFVVNLQLVEVRSAQTMKSVSQLLAGESGEVVLRHVPHFVAELAGLEMPPSPEPVVPAPASPATQPLAAPALPPPAPAPPVEHRSVLGRAFVALGGMSLAFSAASVLASVGGAATALGLLGAWTFNDRLTTGTGRGRMLSGAILGGAALSAGSVVVAILGVVMAVAGFGLGATFNSLGML